MKVRPNVDTVVGTIYYNSTNDSKLLKKVQIDRRSVQINMNWFFQSVSFNTLKVPSYPSTSDASLEFSPRGRPFHAIWYSVVDGSIPSSSSMGRMGGWSVGKRSTEEEQLSIPRRSTLRLEPYTYWRTLQPCSRILYTAVNVIKLLCTYINT